jgi:UDP-glucose 4-epimerase
MHVLITGGKSFSGSHLAQLYLEKLCEVAFVDNLSTASVDNIEHLNCNRMSKFVYGTMFKETLMDRLLPECNIVIHPVAAVRVNSVTCRQAHLAETDAFGMYPLLTVARRYDKKIAITSTLEVNNKNERVPFSETDHLRWKPQQIHFGAMLAQKQ